MSDTSGSLSTSSYNGRYLTFSWSLSGQDVGGNKSTISWRLYGDGPEWVEDGVTWYYCRNVELKIDGSVVYSSGSDSPVELRSGTEVASGSYTLSHQSDGTKAFGVNIQAALYSWSVNVSGYTEWRLPDIARASQPSINSYPNNTPDFNLGDTITIHMNRASSAFTHNVYFYWDNQYIVVATGVTNNCTFNTNSSQTVHGSDGNTYTISSVKQNYLQYAPNDTKKSGYIAVDTYNGGANIGRKTCPFTAHFVNVPPKINSVTITDDNAGVTYPGGKLSAIEGGKYIQGYSKVRFKISAGSDYGATIKQWTITLSGASATGKGDAVYTNLGNGKWSVTVVDSRGNTVSRSGTISVLTYKQLTLDVAGLTRSDSDGTKALISLSGSWHNGSLGAVNNALTLSYSGSNSGSLTPTTSGNTYKVSNTQIAGTYTASSTYGITLTVKDKLSTITRSLTIYEMLPVVAYFKTHFDVFGDLHIHDRNNEGHRGVIDAEAAKMLQGKYTMDAPPNLNDTPRSGIYRIDGTQRKNAPANSTWSHLLVIKGDFITQLCFKWNGTAASIYMRRYAGNPASWSPWQSYSDSAGYANNAGKWNNFTNDIGTVEYAGTWVPVVKNNQYVFGHMAYGVLSPGFSNCQKGDFNYFYRMGRIVFCNINVYLPAGLKSQTTIVNALPKAAVPQAGRLADSANHTARVYAHPGDGTIKMDGDLNTAGWYDGFLTYWTDGTN